MHASREEGVNRKKHVMHFPCRFTLCCLSVPLSFFFSRSTTKPPSTKPDPVLTLDPGGSESTAPTTDTDYSTEQTPAETASVRTAGTESPHRATHASSTRKPGTRKLTTLPPEEQTKFFTTPTEFTTTKTYEAEVTTYGSDGLAEKRSCREEEPKLTIADDDLMLLEEEKRETLRSLCWETMFGQELTKMTVMDLATTAFGIITGDFLRAVVVRYLNGKACFCWDLEKGFPGYTDFPIAEHILHLVNNQGMVWLGMFFSPGLPAINTIKLCILMYLRSWTVLTCNIPHETVFKASGNNFYYALLLLMLFICCLPVAYTCVWLKPSWHCGPFSEYERVYHILTDYVESLLPPSLNKVVDFLLAEDNTDLKSQIRKEKDTLNPEMSKSAMQTDGSVPLLPEKKHVRIQEDLMTSSSDKALLLPHEEPASTSP